MNCDEISKLIPLYYYGELPPEEEEQVDEHTHECSACTRAMEQQRTLAAALDRRRVADVPLHLLEDCRADLMAAVQTGVRRVEKPKGPWTLFLEALAHTFGNMNRLRQPIGAVALVAIGFFAARLTGSGSGSGATASLVIPATDDVYSTVRSVQPDNAGGVVIAFDETRRHTAKGRMDDANIQRLLLAAAQEDNPAVRVESVDLLKNQCRSSEVRDAFLNALANDNNPGVRLKALEGLKPLGADPEVRRVLGRVLLADDNAAVRIEAIDVLASHRDDNMVGLMQSAVQRENNHSVRLKLEKALREMNASTGTF
jgi:anti-sigma factor RsiW